MMTPFQSEELENIARQARKGKRSIERYVETGDAYPSSWLDTFVSILDQVERIKNENKTKDSTAGH